MSLNRNEQTVGDLDQEAVLNQMMIAADKVKLFRNSAMPNLIKIQIDEKRELVFDNSNLQFDLNTIQQKFEELLAQEAILRFMSGDNTIDVIKTLYPDYDASVTNAKTASPSVSRNPATQFSSPMLSRKPVVENEVAPPSSPCSP